MFWCENLRHGNKYCVCIRKWKSFRIAHVKIFGSILEIWITPEHGEKCLLFAIRNGESLPIYLDWNIKFLEWQHVKIEVLGGDIAVVGEINNITQGRNVIVTNTFPNDCPFTTEEDWEYVGKKTITPELESLSLSTSIYTTDEKRDEKSELKLRLIQALKNLEKIQASLDKDMIYMQGRINELMNDLNTIRKAYNDGNTVTNDDVLRLLNLVEKYKISYEIHLQKQEEDKQKQYNLLI